jgi:hypothetical protein
MRCTEEGKEERSGGGEINEERPDIELERELKAGLGVV